MIVGIISSISVICSAILMAAVTILQNLEKKQVVLSQLSNIFWMALADFGLSISLEIFYLNCFFNDGTSFSRNTILSVSTSFFSMATKSWYLMIALRIFVIITKKKIYMSMHKYKVFQSYVCLDLKHWCMYFGGSWSTYFYFSSIQCSFDCRNGNNNHIYYLFSLYIYWNILLSASKKEKQKKKVLRFDQLLLLGFLSLPGYQLVFFLR